MTFCSFVSKGLVTPVGWGLWECREPWQALAKDQVLLYPLQLEPQVATSWLRRRQHGGLAP